MTTQSFNHLFPGYEILGELGRSNARVLSARNQVTGELVAIKHFALNADADTIRRFQRESEIMVSIKNANVVKVKEVQLDAQLPYIVMELVEGGDLRSLLKKNTRLDIPTIIRLGLQMAEAFRAIHMEGIVHRDVKPENIMYRNLHSGELHFLLTDFGIAKLRDTNVSVTGSGMMTYDYASPEQFTDSKRVTAATDYYSMGVVLYECIMGSVPFKLEEGRLHTHINNVISTPPPVLQLPKDIVLPPSLIELANGMLAKEPEERIVEFTQMKRLLKRADLEEADGITSKGSSFTAPVPPLKQQINVDPQPTIQTPRPRPAAPVLPPLAKQNDGSAGIGKILIIGVIILGAGLYLFNRNSQRREVNFRKTTADSTTTTTFSTPGLDTAAMFVQDTLKEVDSVLENQRIKLQNGMFSEKFDSDNGIWANSQNDQRKMGVNTNLGQYEIEGLDEENSYGTTNKFDINTNEDFSFYTRVHWISGEMGSTFGINFCSNPETDSYNFFYLSANGSYGISYYEKGGAWQDVKDWTESDLIKKENDSNILGIEQRNGETIFYINDQEVARHRYGSFYGSEFGFRVGGKQKVAFDDMILKNVP